jgi:hypothetical protein
VSGNVAAACWTVAEQRVNSCQQTFVFAVWEQQARNSKHTNIVVNTSLLSYGHRHVTPPLVPDVTMVALPVAVYGCETLWERKTSVVILRKALRVFRAEGDEMTEELKQLHSGEDSQLLLRDRWHDDD